MAKDKKTDYDKLSLGTKRPIKKEVPQKSVNIEMDQKVETFEKIVEKIHKPLPKKEIIPTKRITLDIPKPLHKAIKNHVYDKDITMKQYFLDLARKDLDQ